jgi:hypothetical protein
LKRALVPLLALLLPVTCLHEAAPPRVVSQRVAVRALAASASSIGPFTLTGAWQLTSPDWRFGSYSALALAEPGRLLAFGDQGYWLDLAKPGEPGAPPRIGSVFAREPRRKQWRDVEAVMRDPATGRLWLALEGRNAIASLRADRTIAALARPPAMQGWPDNSGPEAAVRLADGRVLVIAEASTGLFDRQGHHALLFGGDPADARTRVLAFTLRGPSGYRPTDAALLPDGRVLMLFRRLVWPLPARFAIKLALFDPAALDGGLPAQADELIRLGDPWPVDNYEGLAIEPGHDGTITAWLISDANNAVTQRTLLLRLSLRLADLPGKAKGALVAPRALVKPPRKTDA